MGAKPGQREYSEERFSIPSRFLKYVSRFLFSSDEIQDLEQNNYPVTYTEILDLSVAQSFSNPKVINVPGRAVVIYGVTSATVYDPVANTGAETVDTTVMVFCRFTRESQDTRSNAAVLKHNRGVRGDFTKLYLSWPAQANLSARLKIIKFDETPWYNGEFAT